MPDEAETPAAAGAEPAAATTASAAAHSADEASAAADGLRTTARWIASAFAGIPTLAVAGALIRAPGDAGFDHEYLIWGVLLCAIGAFTGIAAFARVLAPAKLSDQSIRTGVMDHLPEARFNSYTELRAALEEARDRVGAKQMIAADLAGYSAGAEAKAVQAEASAKLMDELLGDNDPPDDEKKAEATAARQEARELRADAGVRAAESAIAAKGLEVAETTYEALDGLRRGAYALQAGDTVQKRYTDALKLTSVAVAFVAVGVICLALAPNLKPEEPEAAAAPTTSLVTLSLNQDGQAALGCDETSVDALQVGGTTEAPTVIVLPGGPCPVRTLTFTTAAPKPLGKVKAAEPVEVG